MQEVCYRIMKLTQEMLMFNCRLVVFIGMLLSTMQVFAASVDELKQQKKDIQLQIQSLKHDLSKKGSMYHSLSKQIAEATKKAQELEKQVKALEAQKTKSKKVLHVVQRDIVDSQTQILKIAEQINVAIKDLFYTDLTNQSNCATAKDQREILLHQEYCRAITKQKYAEYQTLQIKLNNLKQQNDRLRQRVAILKQKEQATAKADQLLVQEKQKKQEDLTQVKRSMQDIAHNIAIYNQKQKMLANKISELLTPRAAHAGHLHHVANPRNIYEEPAVNMSFVKPVNATVITAFGANLPEGGSSKGILYDAVLNADVRAVADGVVLYSGRLTGFGEVVVIAHKAHYLSVYSGILSNVSKNEEISAGQRIGSSGDKSDQPMGGLYFELRHLGVPVKPHW